MWITHEYFSIRFWSKMWIVDLRVNLYIKNANKNLIKNMKGFTNKAGHTMTAQNKPARTGACQVARHLKVWSFWRKKSLKGGKKTKSERSERQCALKCLLPLGNCYTGYLWRDVHLTWRDTKHAVGLLRLPLCMHRLDEMLSWTAELCCHAPTSECASLFGTWSTCVCCKISL